MRKQGSDKTCGIRHHGQIRGVVFSQDRRIYIEVDKLAGGLHDLASRAHLREAATDRQSKITRGCYLAHERRRGRAKSSFFQEEDGIRDWSVTGVQTCALPI